MNFFLSTIKYVLLIVSLTSIIHSLSAQSQATEKSEVRLLVDSIYRVQVSSKNPQLALELCNQALDVVKKAGQKNGEVHRENKSGEGMESMKKRAQEIGADLKFMYEQEFSLSLKVPIKIT